MNILVPCKLSPSEAYLNDFCHSLEAFASVTPSFDAFWTWSGKFDFVHIHWPEYLFNWCEPSDVELLFLEKTLQYWNENSTIVATRHNYYPHFKNTSKYSSLYLLVYKYCEKIIHFSDFSLSEFCTRYSSALFVNDIRHIVIPHPLFSCYENKVDKATARRHLRISQDAKVILVFGNIRDGLECDLVLNSFRALKLKNKFLIVTRFANRKRPSLRKEFCDSIKWIVKSFFLKVNPSYRLLNTLVPNEDVQFYFNAADIVLLPRLDDLNSGVIPLAFSFSKIIVGSKKGNIGEILSNTGNPTFDPYQLDSIKDSIIKGLSMDGQENKAFGISNWSIDRIAMLHQDVVYKK